MGSAAITADSGKQISVPLGHCLQSGNWLESFSVYGQTDWGGGVRDDGMAANHLNKS